MNYKHHSRQISLLPPREPQPAAATTDPFRRWDRSRGRFQRISHDRSLPRGPGAGWGAPPPLRFFGGNSSSGWEYLELSCGAARGREASLQGGCMRRRLGGGGGGGVAGERI